MKENRELDKKVFMSTMSNKVDKNDTDEKESEINKKEYLTKKGIKSTMNETIKNMLESIVSGGLQEGTDTFRGILGEKVKDSMVILKQGIAENLFRDNQGILEELSLVVEKKEESSSEEEDLEEPVRQLKVISSFVPNTREEDNEITKSGEISKHSLGVSKSSPESRITLFKHLNGETSRVSPEDADHLVKHLMFNDQIGKMKGSIIAGLHKDPETFQKVLTIMKHLPLVKESTISDYKKKELNAKKLIKKIPVL